MQIFIDESGIFAVPQERCHSISCVAALILPDESYSSVCRDYQILKEKWGLEEQEVKGSTLSEFHLFDVIRLLAGYDAMLEVTAVDMGLHTEVQITEHKLAQAERMTANLTPDHQESLIQQLKELQAKMKAMPNQLFVQAMITIDLLSKVVQKATLYYVQRKPRELGRFRWVIDAKDNNVTAYEELWSTVMLPYTQSKSLREPFIRVREFDYSFFQRFHRRKERTPGYLRPFTDDISPFEYIDVGSVLREDFSFIRSDQDQGLQLADILCNAARRAMNGNLQAHGWREIGKLTVEAEKGKQVITLVDFASKEPYSLAGRAVPYRSFIRLVERTSKPMLIH